MNLENVAMEGIGMFKDKFIVVGVSGGIAAYKTPNLVRMLIKAGAQVQVIMTKNAMNFISPLTFEALTGRRCITDTFDRNFEHSVEHVSIAKAADAFIIAPATANVIGKIACGIADDMLTTTIMACTCPKLIAPAMNHNMYHNEIVRENIAYLARLGYEIIGPENGMLANGDSGDGRMSGEQTLFDYVERAASHEKDLLGKTVLVTAGATREAIDPVRFITNHSSGKMGLAAAKAAAARGARVTVVKGAAQVKFPEYMNVIEAESAEEMYRSVMDHAASDIIVMAAAVADYTPVKTAESKLKKSDKNMALELKRTVDILKSLGEIKRPGQLICGFSMETENLFENSRKKLDSKNADMIAANSLRTDGAGFGADTNVLTLITHEKVVELPKMSKDAAAHRIFDELLEMSKGRTV